MGIYQFSFGKYKLVERPGESHEGVGRKKMDTCARTGTFMSVFHALECSLVLVMFSVLHSFDRKFFQRIVDRMADFQKLDAMVESALPFVRQWAAPDVHRAQLEICLAGTSTIAFQVASKSIIGLWWQSSVL